MHAVSGSKAFVAIALVGASLSASATALTIDTTAVQANAVFSLSKLANSAVALTGASIAARGNTTAVATSTGLPAFNLPVTTINVTPGIPLLQPLITPNWGVASGSALQITRDGYGVTLANFRIDYGQSLVLADITANGATSKAASLYSFTASDLSIGLSGLALNMHQQLGKLTLASGGLSAFTTGLGLESEFGDFLQTIDFGTITIDVTAALRTPVSAKAYMAVVPEASSWLMMALGLVGIAAVSARRRR